MLQNDRILTLQYEWKEQMIGNEESLKKMQDLITAVKSTYYASSLLTMTETEFEEWYEKNKLLVLVYDTEKHLASFEESLKKYIQVPSVSVKNITPGILHFGFNGETLLAMLEWILKTGGSVVFQETVKEGFKKFIELIKKFLSKGQTQENPEISCMEQNNQELEIKISSLEGKNQELETRISSLEGRNQELETRISSLEGRNREANEDRAIKFASNIFENSQNGLRKATENFGSITIGVGDACIQFGEPKAELEGSQKN
ncbi:hypothetical protein QBX67_27050 [Bacillus sp. LS15-K4]|nr:hypothetical protein [Bacillus sp. LS15-K4]MDJ1478689.1 hypothetical protein [Bacillus sp. LS15-K4]